MSDLLSLADVGSMLDKSADWVVKQARAGVIPCRRIGRTYKFTEQDVYDYIEAAKQPGRLAAVPAASGLTPRSRKRRAS